MTSLVKLELIAQAPFLLALLILAILAYRARRTVALLLLMLASICYFVPRFTPFVVALFFYLRGWKNVPGSVTTWMHSWWPPIVGVFGWLFLGLIIAAFVFFIREQKENAVPHA